MRSMARWCWSAEVRRGLGHAAIQLYAAPAPRSPALRSGVGDGGRSAPCHQLPRRGRSVRITKVALDGVDIVVEVAIAANSRLNIGVGKPRGSIAIHANDSGAGFSLDARRNMTKNLR